jgi:hypothetical protein
MDPVDYAFAKERPNVADWREAEAAAAKAAS